MRSQCLKFNNYSNMGDLIKDLKKIYARRSKGMEDLDSKVEKNDVPEEDVDFYKDLDIKRRSRFAKIKERLASEPMPEKKEKKFFLNDAHAKDYYERHPEEKPEKK